MKDTAAIGFQDAWAHEPWGAHPSNRTLIFPPSPRMAPVEPQLIFPGPAGGDECKEANNGSEIRGPCPL